MRKFNKFLCTILTLIMMLGCMGSTVLAVSSITELNATVAESAVEKNLRMLLLIIPDYR